jgi:hypothetical protein
MIINTVFFFKEKERNSKRKKKNYRRRACACAMSMERVLGFYSTEVSQPILFEMLDYNLPIYEKRGIFFESGRKKKELNQKKKRKEKTRDIGKYVD